MPRMGEGDEAVVRRSRKRFTPQRPTDDRGATRAAAVNLRRPTTWRRRRASGGNVCERGPMLERELPKSGFGVY